MSRNGMPTTTGLARALQGMTLILALVTEVRVEAGRVYVDCIDPDTGNTWDGVPVLQRGGGGERLDNAPIAQSGTVEGNDATQVLLAFRSMNGRPVPVVMGVLSYFGGSISDETGEVDEDDYKAVAVGAGDYAWLNGGTLWQLDQDGNLTATMADDASVRAQFGNGGALVVSRGKRATERLVMHGPLWSYIGALHDHLDAQDARIQALESAMTVIQSGGATVTVNTTSGKGQVDAGAVSFTPGSPEARPAPAEGSLAASIIKVWDGTEEAGS